MRKAIIVALSVIMVIVMAEVGKTMHANDKHDEVKFERKVAVSQILEENG